MIKVGICGAGFMGKMHAACYTAIPDVKVVAVADAHEELKILELPFRLLRCADCCRRAGCH